MGMNAAQKILWMHMVDSKMLPGGQIVLGIDRAAQAAAADRMGAPGQTLIGVGSEAAACGGVGMIAIAAGEAENAEAAENGRISVCLPKIMKVSLTGEMKRSAQEMVSEIARKLPEKSGKGWILEYAGEGAHALPVAQRIVMAGMGYDLGAFASIFPSDLKTRGYLKEQGRAGDFSEVLADPDAEYDGEIALDMDGAEAQDA